jgi:hypothetical protein
MIGGDPVLELRSFAWDESPLCDNPRGSCFFLSRHYIYLCRIFFGSLSASPMAEAGTVEESGVQSEARGIGDQMHGQSTTKENGKGFGIPDNLQRSLNY